MTKTVDHSDPVISAQELADLLGIQAKTIAALAMDGITKRSKRGRYFMRASVLAYCDNLRSAAAGRGSPITAERERLVRAQAEKAIRENRIIDGDLLSAASVSERLKKEWDVVRSTILGIPTRWGQRSPNVTQSDISALDREIRDTLLGLGPKTSTTNKVQSNDQQAS